VLPEELAEHGTEFPIIVYNKDSHTRTTVRLGSCQTRSAIFAAFLWILDGSSKEQHGGGRYVTLLHKSLDRILFNHQRASSSTPSLVGFSDSETSMIGQSMKNLSGAGYNMSPMQQLVKADLPPGCCGMSLSTPPTGAALGDGAFSSQQMLDHTIERTAAP